MIAIIVVCALQADALRSGQEVVLELREDRPSASFTYEVQKDSVVHTYAHSEALDPVLVVSDGVSGAETRDDDSGGGGDAFVTRRASAGDQLRIEVLASEGTPAGTVALELTELPLLEPEYRPLLAAVRRDVTEAQRLQQQGDIVTARERIAQAFDKIWGVPDAGNRAEVQDVLSSAGMVAYATQDFELARRCWRPAWEYKERAYPPDERELQRARQNYALAGRLLGDLSSAMELEEKVLAARLRTLPPESMEVQAARQNLSATLYQAGDGERAVELLNRAVEVLVQSLPDDDPQLLAAQVNLGSMLREEGELAEARELLSRVIAKLGSSPATDYMLIAAQSGLASVLDDLGRLEEARVAHEDLLELLSAVLPPSSRDLQAIRQNLARLLSKLGDHQRARALEEQVLEIALESLPPDHVDYAAAHENLGMTLLELGEVESAKQLVETALELRIEHLPADSTDIQLTRGNLAALLRTEGDLDRALALEREVLASFERAFGGGPHPLLDQARHNLAETLLCAGDPEGAAALSEQIVATYPDSRAADHDVVLNARLHLALAKTLTGSRAEAALHLVAVARGATESLETFDASLSPRALEALALQYLSIAWRCLSLAGELAPEAPAVEAEVFALMEAMRASAATSMRIARIVDTPSNVRATELRARIAKASTEVRRRSEEEDGRTLLEAVVRKDEAESELRRELRSEAEAQGLVPNTSADAIARGLAGDEAAVGYVKYARMGFEEGDMQLPKEDMSYLAYVLRRGRPLSRIELGSAERIDAAVSDWRNAVLAEGKAAVRNPGIGGVTKRPVPHAVEAAGAALRELVFDPLADAVGDASRLYVALDDALHLVPLGALPIGEERVCDRRWILAQSSLKQMTVERAEAAGPPRLVALGGADYDAPPAHAEPVEARTTRGSVGRAPGPPSPGPFQALPETEAEAIAVRELFEEAFGASGGQARVLSGNEASRTAVEELAPGARYLHVATHGYFAEGSGLAVRATPAQDRVAGLAPLVRSGLALAGANVAESGTGQGILTGEELSAVDLSGCELAVLSACGTNLGHRRAGQGVASLQQALHAAGAGATLTSLWSVPDEATSVFMRRFYAALWMRGASPAEALRETQAWMRGLRTPLGEARYDTFDWAAWVLIDAPREGRQPR